MPEKLTLTTPIVPAPLTDYQLARVLLDWEHSLIRVELVGPNGERQVFHYQGDVARTAMLALNKANLSVKSFQRRVMEFIVAQGGVVGTVTGTPD